MRHAVAALAFTVVLVAGADANAAPAEYVKVCSIYGAGWNYIPGSDTCMKADTGETRVQTSIGTKQGQTELSSRVGATESAVVDLYDAQAKLEARFDDAFSELSDGIAMSMALADPDLVSGEHFGIKVNWGTYSDSNAFGVSFAGVLAETDKARVTLSGGVATTGRYTAGRVGMQFSW